MACSEISLQIVREHLPAAVDLETVIAQVRRGVDDEGRDIAETQIPLHTRLYIAWHVALGLRELHMRGIAHGDLSQANVLVRTHTLSLDACTRCVCVCACAVTDGHGRWRRWTC
jgi:RIO-like serine/threonine protein kinase